MALFALVRNKCKGDSIPLRQLLQTPEELAACHLFNIVQICTMVNSYLTGLRRVGGGGTRVSMPPRLEYYFTGMFSWLETTPFMFTTMGCAPLGMSAGIRTLIWYSPMLCGDSPA